MPSNKPPLNLIMISKKDKDLLYRKALLLALITIIYNIIEGIVSVYLGVEDNTIALAGFGLDSFVETISGIGIFHMIKKAQKSRGKEIDHFEKTALKVTGIAFYLLATGLIFGSAINLYMRNQPETTLWGIIISLISLMVMWLLIHYKLKVGKRLNSQAIIADANCSKACMILSLILLVSSLLHESFGLGDIDSIGAFAIALWSFKEGKEAFRKTYGIPCKCEQ
ncbi:MAG: cation transporter [Thermodesulfovibrionales bacterium]|nr:cation transporter [Thermodesulfovibrionales bacterium]